MFIISTYLARINDTARVKEFTNKHYMDLAKYLANKDIKGIASFFDETLQELLLDKELYGKLTCIEKFVIWLDIYYNCIHDYISLGTSSGSVSVDIKGLISRVNSQSFIDKKIISIDNILITLNAPLSLLMSEFDDIIDSIIYSIEIDKKYLYLNNLAASEKEMFLNSLPAGILEEILNYHKEISKKAINIAPRSKILNTTSLNISVTNNSIYDFLKSIYASELYTHYNNILIFTKQLNGDYSSYLNMTPKEFLSLYKVYEKNITANRG